jgi:hypothetical protein
VQLGGNADSSAQGFYVFLRLISALMKFYAAKAATIIGKHY